MAKKILIADDLATIVMMVKSILMQAGYDVITASDGLKAIHAVYTHRPDLVILDVMMPNMNGYQVCRLMKSDPATSNIPVIMLTSRDHPIDQFWGEHSGSNAYLGKDIIKDSSSGKLLDQINELLRNSRAVEFYQEDLEGLSDISDNEILSRVNNLLDRKLLETTVVSEIRTLVKDVWKLEKNLAGILFLTRKLLNFDMGTIMLTDRKGNNLIVGAITASVEASCAESTCEQVYNEWLAGHPELEREKLPAPLVSVFKNITGETDDTTHKQAVSHLRSGFKTHLIEGNCLLTSHKKAIYTERDQEILDSVIREARMIMDNMWLYRTIEKLSITDGLTSFYNHRYFYNVMKKTLTNRRREDNSFSLIMFDIDRFKNYNDTYGHQQGDQVILETCQIISQIIRQKDISVRYGGDEFVIMLPGTPLNLAMECAERIRFCVENHPFIGPSEPLKVTISLGVNYYCPKRYPNGLEDLNKIISDTDEAMYISKEKGRNTVTVVELPPQEQE